MTVNQQVEARADLRTFLALARERDEVEVIRGADPYLEMGALYELSLRDLYPRVLLFEAIPGFPPDYRVIVNVRFSKIFVGELNVEAVKAFRSRRRWEGEPILPVEVATGPILANVKVGEDVHVRAFPAPHWHKLDGGPYIGTECLVITKDPESDWVNVGTYRVQVQDDRTLSVFIEPGKHGSIIRQKYWDRGEACPMVVVVGQAPVLGNVAGTVSRLGVSELATAGGIIGRPIEVVSGRLTGLPIPAAAELAFEGFMPPLDQASAPEGPFAEWPGYYATETHDEAVLQVQAIYHRDDPMIVGQPPAKPTLPGRQPSIAGMAALWDAIEGAGVPGVTGVWKPLGGGVRFVNIIAIKQLHEGHAKRVGLAAAASAEGAYLGRITIVVDDDIDIMDPAEVMWALATRWDPKTQTDIIDGCWSGYIDPIHSPEKLAQNDLSSSRIIIYAVRPFRWKDRFPKVSAVEPGYLGEVERKWQATLGFLQSRPLL